jgi:hypothetical protein
MKRAHLAPLALLVAALMSAVAQNSADMPMLKVEGESLAGHHIVLPDAASGKVAVLIFGFTKASKVPTAAWAKKISPDFANQPAFALYQLPVLEDVPRLVRGMVISSIRKGVHEETRDHFVPILNGEADLKKLVSYKEPDDAYLVVLSREGKIVGQMHGAVTDAAYAPLKTQLESLLNGVK